MNTIKSTIHTEAIFSDDEQHRYLLKKTWDEKKPVCTVITMYPHLDLSLIHISEPTRHSAISRMPSSA